MSNSSSHRIKTTPNITDNRSQKSALAFACVFPPFPLGPTSNGLPPPPKASGLLPAALVRWAWLVSVVATPLLKAVVTKTWLPGGVLAEADVVEVAEDDAEVEDAELAADVRAETVEVRRTVVDVVSFDLDFDDEEDSVVVVSDVLLAAVDDVEGVVVLEDKGLVESP